MTDTHEWESTLAKFEDPIDKLGYLFGLTHYSLESGADCYVEIKKILPVVHARCESLRDKLELLEAEKAVMREALDWIMKPDHYEPDDYTQVACFQHRANEALSKTTPSLLLDVLKVATDYVFFLDKDAEDLRKAIRTYRAAMNGEK